MKKKIKKGWNSINKAYFKLSCILRNIRGEGYVDSGVKILIAVVIGALILAGLYLLFNDIILQSILPSKINKIINYAGK